MNAKLLHMYKTLHPFPGKVALKRRSQRPWRSTGEKLTHLRIRGKNLWREPDVLRKIGTAKAKHYPKHFKPSRPVRLQHRIFIPQNLFKERKLWHLPCGLEPKLLTTQREYYYGNVRPNSDTPVPRASRLDWTLAATGAPTNRDLKRYAAFYFARRCGAAVELLGTGRGKVVTGARMVKGRGRKERRREKQSCGKRGVCRETLAMESLSKVKQLQAQDQHLCAWSRFAVEGWGSSSSVVFDALPGQQHPTSARAAPSSSTPAATSSHHSGPKQHTSRTSNDLCYAPA
jgi:hypothetical protein